jgi:hypothetical protein
MIVPIKDKIDYEKYSNILLKQKIINKEHNEYI